ncbi:MAG: hypothetical protein SGPRY_010218 [Prymnesium sp.]
MKAFGTLGARLRGVRLLTMPGVGHGGWLQDEPAACQLVASILALRQEKAFPDPVRCAIDWWKLEIVLWQIWQESATRGAAKAAVDSFRDAAGAAAAQLSPNELISRPLSLRSISMYPAQTSAGTKVEDEESLSDFAGFERLIQSRCESLEDPDAKRHKAGEPRHPSPNCEIPQSTWLVLWCCCTLAALNLIQTTSQILAAARSAGRTLRCTVERLEHLLHIKGVQEALQQASTCFPWPRSAGVGNDDDAHPWFVDTGHSQPRADAMDTFEICKHEARAVGQVVYAKADHEKCVLEHIWFRSLIS